MKKQKDQIASMLDFSNALRDYCEKYRGHTKNKVLRERRTKKMNVVDISRLIVKEKSAKLIKLREGQTTEYDYKPLFTGKRAGWTILDMFTAQTIVTVFDALSDEGKEKLLSLPLRKMITIVFKVCK